MQASYVGNHADGSATRRQSLIRTNLAIQLGSELNRQTFEMHIGGLGLTIKTADLRWTPDIIVVRGEDEGRGTRVCEYRKLPSLLEYLAVDEGTPHVEHRRHQPGNTWIFWESRDPGDSIPLASIGIDLPLAEIYLKIDFTPDS